MNFDGIYTPIVTPHDPDGAIDKATFAKVAERLISAGVHGIIVAGTTGEYYAQTLDERIDLMGHTVDVVAGRVPVVVGTGAMRTEDAITLAVAAKEAGADAILIGTPPYAVPTGRENALHALAVDRAVNMPVMLYNYPGRMAAEMDEDFLDRVGRSLNFRSIKESSGDINRLHLLARDYPHIQLLCGMDDQALEFFAWGARGWVCAGSNFAPEAHIALWRACVIDGDFAKGRRIMSAMLPLMRVLEQGGKFVQCIRHGMALRGLPVGPVRRPLRDLDKDEKRDLKEVVEVMDRAIAAIEAGSEDPSAAPQPQSGAASEAVSGAATPLRQRA
ncbi:MAG: dihydrodipicolinate synthase family protein [Pseudomonadota bacterium]